MPEIYACQKYTNVRNICMSEIHVCQKYVYVFSEIYILTKSGLQVFLVRVLLIYQIKIFSSDIYSCALKILEKHSNVNNKANVKNVNRR